MLECIELFAGAGGMSHGLKNSGIRVKVAVDVDKDCERTYTHNHPRVTFIQKRVQDIKRNDLLKYLSPNADVVLAGGPPCQLFSRLNRNPAGITDEVKSYVRLVRSIRPMFVVFENVPAIQSRSEAWTYVIASLQRAGYFLDFKIVDCIHFGVAQSRQRMIVLASKFPISIPLGNCSTPRTVRDCIGNLDARREGLTNHQGMQLSPTNLKKIRLLKEGEISRDWDSSFRDSYARMAWDKPAPTITTKCISFSNGRFGHPEQDRALTVREAALIQGFPEQYQFFGSLRSCARQVGNAVPPLLALALGREIRKSHRRALRNKARKLRSTATRDYKTKLVA